MELRQIRYFAAVARHRHFTRAAEELGLAQPALSQQVRALERELGVLLIDRSGRRVRITDAGEAFLAWAERILADVAAAEAEMAEFAGVRKGRVVIGTTPVPTLGRVDLPGILAGFHARYPGIEIALREATTPSLVADLALGRLDLAFGALLGEPLPDGIVAEPLFAEELVAVVAPGHRLAGQESVPLAELAPEPFALAPPGSPIRRAVEEAAAARGLRIQIAFETSEQSLVRELVSRRLAVSAIPRSLAEEPGAPVAILPLADLALERTIALLWAVNRPRTAAAARFIAWVNASRESGVGSRESEVVR